MRSKKLLTIFAFSAGIFIISCKSSSSMADYNEITSFSKEVAISFPDFALTYTGERKQTNTFPNGNSFTFTYYDFKIRKDSEEKTISWTSGTGEIAPAHFEISGMRFMLELKYWEKEKKKLDEDELVVTKQ